MRASELRGRDRDDLLRDVRRLRRELFDMRFRWQAEEDADTSRRSKTRRDLARLLTVLREKEQAASGDTGA